MKKALFLILTFLGFVSFGQAQDTIQETLKSDGVTNNITASKTGMYGGTKSDKAAAHYQKAFAFAEKEDYGNAEKFYLKALKEDPNFVEVYDNLGRVYRRIGKLDEAIKYYKKSLELYPDGMMARQNLALVYTIKKNYKGAIEQYKNMVKLEPKNPEGYFGLANTQMMLGEFDNAIKNAKEAIDLYEKSKSYHTADGYYLLGMIYYYKEDIDNAKKYVALAKEKGAKIHPDLEKELLGESSSTAADELRLETKEDYAKHEQTIINGYQWLLETPLDKEPEARKEISAFMMRWMVGSPNVSIGISDKIVTYLDCGDCLMIFMGGWAKYALESKDYKNELKGNLAGTEGVIAFYTKNKKALGTNKDIEKLIKLQKENKLEDYIKSNLK